MIRVIGLDANSIERVWAEDAYEQTAFGFCHEEAVKYVKRRPDTGPLSEWSFHNVQEVLEQGSDPA